MGLMDFVVDLLETAGCCWGEIAADCWGIVAGCQAIAEVEKVRAVLENDLADRLVHKIVEDHCSNQTALYLHVKTVVD